LDIFSKENRLKSCDTRNAGGGLNKKEEIRKGDAIIICLHSQAKQANIYIAVAALFKG
jgi:hypothetical protein